METLKFKTNIKCSGCIATVTPFLNEVSGQDSWKVDLESPDKVLVVDSSRAISGADVIEALQKAGYRAEELEKS
ncbi:heavy-metal-associated domain-containing protein [Chitinophaga japonensis]|uniref:Copper chaperone CopZ n=1 Tax=Chitinophaga japonensis TaxID=104662 RepID=A0A562T123_CHIJA|nr:heavy-metal-associated domain-containing protein [Chitinophaga japonensis]TWI86993.1 copper chaperone CopZ [Chitinophaga japonensis]